MGRSRGGKFNRRSAIFASSLVFCGVTQPVEVPGSYLPTPRLSLRLFEHGLDCSLYSCTRSALPERWVAFHTGHIVYPLGLCRGEQSAVEGVIHDGRAPPFRGPPAR